MAVVKLWLVLKDKREPLLKFLKAALLGLNQDYNNVVTEYFTLDPKILQEEEQNELLSIYKKISDLRNIAFLLENRADIEQFLPFSHIQIGGKFSLEDLSEWAESSVKDLHDLVIRFKQKMKEK